MIALPIEYLDIDFLSTAVERDAGVLRGVVICQTGDFRTKRGSFDLKSLSVIQSLASADKNGLPCYFGHPDSKTGQRRPGTFLGRLQTFRLGKVSIVRDGATRIVDCLRGDLHWNPVASLPAIGGGAALREYITTAAENDPSAIAGSLVLRADREQRSDSRNASLPPIWRPTSVESWDIVDKGDASDQLLSGGWDADAMTDDDLRAWWADTRMLYAPSRDETGWLESERLRWENQKRKAGV